MALPEDKDDLNVGVGESVSTESPTVSIGLPVYNGEQFIGRAIESVLSQTFEDWELLISDNGSEDSTAEIASRYAEKDPRIRFRRNEVNEGAVANFEVVFRETSGPFFMWIAYDDWIHETYVERLLKQMQDNRDLVLAFAGQQVVNENSVVFRTRTEPITAAAQSRDVLSRFHTIQWNLVDPTAPVFGLMRRSALENTGLIRNTYEPDRVLVGEMVLLGGIHQEPDLLFFHYGPVGHTDRDEFAWLNPLNRGRPLVTGLSIVKIQWQAIWGSDFSVVTKTLLATDLLVASLAKRVQGKIKAMIRKSRSKASRRARYQQ